MNVCRKEARSKQGNRVLREQIEGYVSHAAEGLEMDRLVYDFLF